MAQSFDQTQTALQPPKAPEIERKLKFYRLQAFGVPLIALFPLLALFKVFDTTRSLAFAEQSGLRVEVSYPDKIRDRTTEPFQVTVRNNTGTSQNLTVEIDQSYFEQFQNVQFEPDADGIVDERMQFEFEDVKPGEARTVEATFENDDLGVHRAQATVKTEGGEEAAVQFSTFAMP